MYHKKNSILSLLVVVVLFISGISFADEEGDYNAFIAAKKAYEDGFYVASLDLFNRFIEKFPESKYFFEAKLFIALCYYQKEDFIKARDILSELEKLSLSNELNEKVLFWLGQVYFQAKDFKQSADYFEKLIQKHPKSYLKTNAKMQLGLSLFLDGRYKQAIDVFDKLFDSEDLAIQEQALFEKGQAFYQLKDYENVIRNYKIFIDGFSNSKRLGRVYFYLAESNFYLKNFNEAIKYYQKAINSNSDKDLLTMAFVGLGWSYIEQGDFSKAEEAFGKVVPEDASSNMSAYLLGKAVLSFKLNKFEQALNFYDELIKQYPKSDILLQAYFGKAQCLDNLKRYSESIQCYKNIIDKASELTTQESKDLISDATYNLAWAYLRNGDSKSAIEEFGKVVNTSKDKAIKFSSLCQIGDVYQDIKEYDKAIETYNKILKEYPDNPYNDYVQFQLGYAMMKSNQLDSAIIAFRSLNKNFVNSTFLDDANFYLGYCYFQKQEFHNCIKQLQSFIDIFPSSIYRDRALYLLGASHYNVSDYSEAVAIFERIIKEFHYNNELVEKTEYDLADSLLAMGREKEAVGRFRKFLDKYPNSPMCAEIIFLLGQYYYRNNKYDLARSYFEQIVRSYPQNEISARAKYEIGMTFFEEKNYIRAIRSFNELINQDNLSEQIKIRALLAVGDLYLEQNNKPEAIKMYEQVLNKNSEYSKIGFLKLADLYKANKEYDKAIDLYSRAKRFFNNESYAAIQFKIGECLQEQHKFDAALEAYLEIPHLYQKDTIWVVKALLRCARIYEDRENWQDAIKIYQQVLAYPVAESKFAEERIELIKKYIREERKSL